MKYFERHYSNFSYSLPSVDKQGFRPSQTAAIQAVSAHLYSHSEQSAIVVMPTGSGKTAVINALCFTQRAKRALIITPSRLVREQIAEDFKTIKD